MNIFEYFKKKGIDTIDSSFYSKIAMWDSWYRANVKRFHQYRVYHGTGQYERCHRKSLGMAKKICEDISDLLLNERVTITIKDETTAKFVRSVLDAANFTVQGNEYQERKGVAFHRRRFEARLHQYFMQNGTNEGYILLVDFSGYYANIPHDKCLEVLQTFLEREVEDPETLAITEMLLPLIFKTFEQDVSRFTDKEIEAMMAGKIDPMLNYGVDPALLTGEKMLRKGVDIGSQPSQNIGIVYPYRLDNYAKIVKAVKGYGRYTDDSYAIARTREELLELLDGLEKEAKEYGLIINRKKTRIVKLSSEFRHLQVCYSLTETGRIIRKINPKNITRERRKLKAYKRLLDSGRIDYATVENAFKSWLGSHWKYMSHDQVYNMSSLYYELFGRRPKWKKGHGRLHWLMAHPSTASTSTGTTTSAPPPSPRPPSPVSSPA